MENTFKYFFNEKTKIFYKYYLGNISFDDIQNSWDNIISNNLIPDETVGFIIDYRDATLQMESAEHQKIVTYYQKNIEIFKDKKIAIITEDPKDIVIPTLVRLKDKGYSSKPFSTESAAINWIKQ
ncbi:MAG: hypothetical protein PF436_09545 [Prolixibacteraceae bacterium]|jgi:hypothetical protein|nr:hypothetical protein [Prolixibacteraceae bacterium]